MIPVLDGVEEKNYSVQSFRMRYRCATPPPTKSQNLLTSPQRVVEMARALFRDLDFGTTHEHFGVFYLNTQNELIGFKAINDGTVDQVAVYPRMIVHTALMVGAAGMILVHNHPSGYIDPSEEDKNLTRTLTQAARLFDVSVRDHLIISEAGYFSFIERGLL